MKMSAAEGSVGNGPVGQDGKEGRRTKAFLVIESRFVRKASRVA
jgi:hypothetical protein